MSKRRSTLTTGKGAGSLYPERMNKREYFFMQLDLSDIDIFSVGCCDRTAHRAGSILLLNPLQETGGDFTRCLADGLLAADTPTDPHAPHRTRKPTAYDKAASENAFRFSAQSRTSAGNSSNSWKRTGTVRKSGR